jgi:hypothetical protein
VRWIRPGRWIVWDRAINGMVGSSVERLYDPDTREKTPIVGRRKHDGLIDLAEDGRMVVMSSADGLPDSPRELVLLDPESGERETIAVPGTIELRRSWVRVAGFTPSGRQLLRLESAQSRKSWFARLEMGDGTGSAGPRLVATAPLDMAELLGSAAEDSLIAIESARRLVRLRFDGSPPELLFPR